MMVGKRDYAVDRRLLMISALALLIGAISTLAAKLLICLIDLATNLFFYQRLSLENLSPAQNSLGLWVILIPVVGGLIVGLMARYGSEKIRGHGIPEAIEAILFVKSRMSPKVAVLKPLSSAVVIGSGGPFGAEGPIIMTGGSLASLLGQYLHLNAIERKTLLVAGASAGMTAIFGTPVAAVLLAVELLLFELRPRSLVPVALACAVAGFLRSYAFGDGPLMPLETAPAGPLALISCLIAGVVIGLLAVVVTHLLHAIEKGFARLPLHWMWWPALGGLIIGIGGYLQPRALGVGYDVIEDLLHANLTLTVIFALIAVKLTIWLFALASGTSGGVLAPLLMVGAGVGALLAHWLPGGSPQMWAMAGMAAMLGSALGSPLTAIVFAVGITHDANGLLPDLLTTSVAWGITTLLLSRSIMTDKITRRGQHIFREYGVDPLERAWVEDVMEPQAVTFAPTLDVAAAKMRLTTLPQLHHTFPVTEQGRCIGMVDYRAIHQADDRLLLSEILRPVGQHYLLASHTARQTAMMMAENQLTILPVLNSDDEQQLAGVISSNDLLKPTLRNMEEELVRERLR